MSNAIEKIIAETFMEMAEGLSSGQFGKKPKIAVTAIGSEHGEANIMAGAKLAKKVANIKVIGTIQNEDLDLVSVSSEEEGHKVMDNLLNSKEVDAVVTMHYPFPIGVSTVGRAIAPGTGKEVFIATTTGTASSERVESMIKNTINGIIAAKACGIKNPTVGILNIDGARQTESALKELKANGYDITFASSKRSDGGCILRGNDILTGAADVIVADSLTGNIILKMLSSYTTGGSFESVGYGYGPGIGEGYDKLIMIISRASGTPVVEGAIKYAADLIQGNYFKVAKDEFSKANKAKLKDILLKRKPQKEKTQEKVSAPPKEVVTAQISGIEIMELDDAVEILWAKGIYAESGMGCTGPIVLVSNLNEEKAICILQDKDLIMK